MNTKDENILFHKFCELYNSTKKFEEPFTFWMAVQCDRGEKFISKRFNSDKSKSYANVGIVSFGCRQNTRLIGLSFSPYVFDKVEFVIGAPTPENIKTYIDRVLKKGYSLTESQIQNFIAEINSKDEFSKWIYTTTIDDPNLIKVIYNKYLAFFKFVKKYDEVNDTKFYDILKIGSDTFEKNLEKHNNKYREPEVIEESRGLDGDRDKNQDMTDVVIDDNNNVKEPSHPLNLILYGPPGTGKTYNTLFHALAIVENRSVKDVKKEKEGFDKFGVDGYKELKKVHKYDDLVKSGQIVFTTFHQSMSYEDFIEGIKPIIDDDKKIVASHYNKVSKTKSAAWTTEIENLSRMKYEVTDGIFKKMCDLMAFLKNAKEQKISFKLIVGDNFTIESIDKQSSKIQCYNSKNAKRKNIVIKYDELVELVSSDIEITNVDAVTKFFNRKRGLQEDSYLFSILNKFKEKKVLIIDEINRGNVAQIFGELITLIEPSKRLGNNEAMTATLPYSQEPFGVPDNLYIIGTMNTADRSVEALDTALRRRFDFEEMMPKLDSNLLKIITVGNGANVYNVDLLKLLETINNRIVVLKDREHQIGHSYFMKCETEDDLKNAFKKNIVPLLQEYFFGNYAYIGLVLGKMFVMEDDMANNLKFADGFSYDYGDETIYRLLTDEEWEKLNLKEAIEKLGEGIVK